MNMTPGSKRASHGTRARSARVTLTPDDATILRATLGPALSRDDAASICGVTRRTVDRWRKRGAITVQPRATTSVADLFRGTVVLNTDSVLAMITRKAICAGCCSSCDGRGMGGPASGPETNGRCADCYGKGHDGPCGAAS